MDYEKLIKSMETSAEEKQRTLIDNAERKAEEMISEALVIAEDIKRAHLSGAEKAAEIERNKLLYLAKNDIKKDLNNVKYEIFHKAFSTVKTELADIRNKINYSSTFQKLLEESLQSLGEKEVILHIDKMDEGLCKDVIKGLDVNCEIKTDITCSGGLNVSTKDERIYIFNTIESRLDRAKDRLRMEIFSTLFGD